MITIGYDCGTQLTKAVLLQDGKVLAKAFVPTAFDATGAAQELKKNLLEQVNMAADKVDKAAMTGVGSNQLTGIGTTINEVSSAAKGVSFLLPEADSLIDMGANNTKAIKLGRKGVVISYELNDKCASGTGAFIEAMARVLNVTPEEFGRLALDSKKDLTISAQCAVFVESEVISLVHHKETGPDIAHGVLAGIASRTSSMVKRLGSIGTVALIGGCAMNAGLVRCLEKDLNKKITVPEDALYVQAIGAGLFAAGE